MRKRTTNTYDDVGNRTGSHLSSTYGYHPGQVGQPHHFNRLVSTATANYSYDSNGNIDSKAEGFNFWRYGWDHENRLTSASTRKQSVRYKYDALGRRVQQVVGSGRGKPTRSIYDGEDVLVDKDVVDPTQTGTLTKYLNGPGIDNKLRIQTGSDVNYFLADHLGSTNGLADSSGNITASTSYDSFGNQMATLSTRYGFTGRERDDFTGLMYYRARFYDPNLGRFISEDPIGFGGGDINLYGYVWNNPLYFVDAMGLYPDGPVNYLRDPFDQSNWIGNGISNTISDLLSLDEIAEASFRLGDHGLTPEERAQAGVNLAITTGANVVGGGFACKMLGKAGRWIRRGEEMPLGPNLRIAPFGNRTGHKYGKWPHYHRRGPRHTKGNKKGQPLPGQSIDRHRPWEPSQYDKNWRDRF